MKTSTFKSVLYTTIFIGLFSGCVNDDDYTIPNLECIDPTLTANKTIQQIFNQATAVAVLYTTNDVIEAYVISSDKDGNYFKTLHLQTLDNPIGFKILADYPNLATLYQPGRKVLIKIKGLYTQIKDGGLLIGSLHATNMGRISQFDTPKVLLRDCSNPVNEELLVQRITITDAISSDVYLNKLVEFDNVQFKDDAVGHPYYIANSSGTNRRLTDYQRNEITVRSTSFTKFGADIIPEQSGKVKGILTRFGTTYQFIPRFKSDIQLTQPRF